MVFVFSCNIEISKVIDKQFSFYSEYNFINFGKKNILSKWDMFLNKTITDNSSAFVDQFKKRKPDTLMQHNFFISNVYQAPIETGKKTSNFGMRINPFNGDEFIYHSGIDIGCESGTKISAVSDGEVVFVGYKDVYGKMIMIKHQHGYTSLYGHLKTIFVNHGQKIKMGTVIGRSGNTGLSTGPHLHFEIRHNNIPKNPYGFIRL